MAYPKMKQAILSDSLCVSTAAEQMLSKAPGFTTEQSNKE